MNYYKHLKRIEGTDLYMYVKEYLYHMLVIGRSEHTHKRYQSALREFTLWAVQRRCSRLSAINRNTLKRYREYLYDYRKTNGEPLSKGSKNSKLTPVKVLCQWCYQERYIETDIAYDFEIPKKPKGLPTKILMHDAVEKIFKQPDISTPEGLRDRTIMELLYSTAIRRSEAVFLRCSDIDFVREEVKINEAKNGEDRVLPVANRTLDWVVRYLKEARPRLLKGEDNDALFLSHTGEQFLPGTMASRVKTYIKQAGIDTRGACHLLRHSSATQMLENGADIRFLQAFLGHKDLNTTEIYTRVSPKMLREVYSQTHPIEVHERAVSKPF